VRALGEKLPQPLSRLRDGVGSRHTEGVEPGLFRLDGERRLERGGIAIRR
jgi:hypothetical protein